MISTFKFIEQWSSMTKLKSNWFSTFLYKQYALYLVSLTVEFRIQTTLQILYACISLMSPFLLLQILDALTTIEQVTIARVYNWDVHQRRLRQASPSAMESWVESSLPPCWQYVSIPNSLHIILIVILFVGIVSLQNSLAKFRIPSIVVVEYAISL